MPMETYIRLNSVLHDERVTVTTTPQTIYDLLTTFDQLDIDNVKTMTVYAAGELFFGADASISASNAGGIIKKGEKIEMPFFDINHTPYFVAGSNTTMFVVLWS